MIKIMTLLSRAHCNIKEVGSSANKFYDIQKWSLHTLEHMALLRNANADICIIVKFQILSNFVPFKG